MSDRNEEKEEEGVPMELFWLGNFEEGNKVDADYLDEDARNHLSGLTKIDIGPRLIDLAEGETVGEGEEGAGEDVVQSADALDFADEVELIEDFPLTSAQQQDANIHTVDAAFGTIGAAAEDEDYDFDEPEEDALVATRPPVEHPVVVQRTDQPAPSTAATTTTLTVPIPTGPMNPEVQSQIAKSRGIFLPVIGKDVKSGAPVLAFTDLFRPMSKGTAAARAQEAIRINRRRVRFDTARNLQFDSMMSPGSNEIDREIELLKATPTNLVDIGFQLRPEVEGEEEEEGGGGHDDGVNDDGRITHDTAMQGKRNLNLKSKRRDRGGDHGNHGIPRTSQDLGGVGSASQTVRSGDGDMVPLVVAADPKVGTSNAELHSAHVHHQVQHRDAIHNIATPLSNESTQGPVYATFPPCVFDPVMQLSWDLNISGVDIHDIHHDTFSEKESDDEEDQHVITNTKTAKEAENRETQEEKLMEDDEEEEEEKEKRQRAVAECELARRMAAMSWQSATSMAQMEEEDDEEEQVTVLGGTPLLRYSNPLQALFPLPSTTVAAVAEPVPAPQVTTENGEQAGPSTSAAAAPPQQQQQQQPQQQQQQQMEVEDIDVEPLPVVSARYTPAWESTAILEGGTAAAELLKTVPLTFDLNDPNLIFLDISKKGERSDQFRAFLDHATCTILPRRKKSTVAPKPADSQQENEAALELARINISRDNDYFAEPKKRAGSGSVRAVHHSKFASNLNTIPLFLTEFDMSHWHRCRGVWWPYYTAPGRRISQASYPVGGRVSLRSLVGDMMNMKYVTYHENSPADVWKEYWNPAKKRGKDKGPNSNAGEAVVPPLPLLVIPDESAPTIIQGNGMHVPIASLQLKVHGGQVDLLIAHHNVDLQPTNVVDTVPSEPNAALLRAPMAFSSTKELTASTPGRVVLVEYFQDSPLFLNRPGMGARLATYYKRTSPIDLGHQKVRDEAIAAKARWRVGAINPMNEDDESPFLGELEPGMSQLSIETGLFTAPAAAHDSQPSDFLFTRSAQGDMALREITGTVLSGQQLPLHRIPFPGSRDLKDLEERRIYVYIFRDLRRRMQRAEQRNDTSLMTVSLQELCQLFPHRPQTALRIFLKDGCDLIFYKKYKDDELYVLRDGARIPSEPELRRKFTPEDACVLEACRVAEHRMLTAGLIKADKFNYGNVAAEKLRMAAEMLPQDPETQAAAKMVENLYVTAAWNLTEAFMSSFREGRATMRLLGPGDPTGRGIGYSFVRDVRHKGTGNDDPTKFLSKQRTGKVQGTDADLRRMTTEQAKQKLMFFGLDEAEIEPLGRWVRIDLVRQLANASAADGSVQGIAKYVRHQKTTLIELQKKYRERAQQIFHRQRSVLNNSAEEELGDQAALEAELEAELAAEEREENESSPSKSKTQSGKRDTSPSPEDEARQLEEMRAAGFLGSENTPSSGGQDSAVPSTSTSAPVSTEESGIPLVPGQTRRIRREVMHKNPDGTYEKVHEVVYLGRDRPLLLASLYQKEGAAVTGPWGFGMRTIHTVKVQQRLSYSAARGRGNIRGTRGRPPRSGTAGRPRGSGRGRARGRGRGRYPRDEEFDTSLIIQGERSSKRNTKQIKTFIDDFEDLDDFVSEEEEDDFEAEALTDDEDFNPDEEILREEGYTIEKPKQPKIVRPKQPKPPSEPQEPREKKEKKPPKPKKEKPPAAPIPTIESQYLGDKELAEYLGEDEENPEVYISKSTATRRRGGTSTVEQAPAEVNDFGVVQWDPFTDGLPHVTDMTLPPKRSAAANMNGKYVAQHDDYYPEDDGDSDFDGKTRRTRKSSRSGRTTGGRVRVKAEPTRPTRAPSSRTRKRKAASSDDMDDEDDEFLYYSEEDSDEDRKRSNRNKRVKVAAQPKLARVPARASTGGVLGVDGSTNLLGAVLLDILNDLKVDGDSYSKGNPNTVTFWNIFEPPVPNLPRYKDYVKQPMCLREVKKKAQQGKYNTPDEFMSDIQLIRNNCHAYHHPETGGPKKFPHLLEYADGLVGYIEGKMQGEYNSRIEKAMAGESGGGSQQYRGGPSETAAAAFDDIPEWNPGEMF